MSHIGNILIKPCYYSLNRFFVITISLLGYKHKLCHAPSEVIGTLVVDILTDNYKSYIIGLYIILIPLF